jgi:membrane protease YdiL (CAAX protease family)
MRQHRWIEAPDDQAKLRRLSKHELLAFLGVLLVCSVALGISVSLRHAVNIWLTTGLTATLCLAATLAAGAKHIPSYLTWDARKAALGFAFGLTAIPVTHLAFRIFGAQPTLTHEVTELYASLHAWPGPVAALPLLIFVIAVEELVYRGVLQHVLQELLGKPSARHRAALVLLGTFVYLAPQLISNSLVLVLVAGAWGMIWTLERLYAGSVLVPFITHATWSIGVFVLFPVR